MAIDITTLGAANSYTNKHSGEGGTSDYSDLTNKPAINDVTLSGNKSSEDLGLQDTLTFDNTPTEDSENPVTSDGVYKALGGKLDTLNGTSSDIGKLIIVDSDGNTIAISNILISDLVTTEDLHSAINGIFIVADELPTASEDTLGEIYLIPNGGENPNVRDEYLTTRDGTEGAYTYAWEKIGTTDIDLSGYVPTSRTIAGVDLEDDITASELREALNVEDGAEANVQADWGQSSTAADDFIKNKPKIPSKVSDLENDSGFEANVQADWGQQSTAADDFIKNKPTIPTVNESTKTISDGTNSIEGIWSDEDYEIATDAEVASIFGKSVKYIKFIVTDVKNPNEGYTQLSKVEFLDSNNQVMSWTGTTATCNKTPSGSSEGADKLIDGSIDTKACIIGAATTENPVIFTFENQGYFNLHRYNKWQWYTANDSPERDPISFTLQVSGDGTTWTTIDTATSATITNDRQALAYTKTFSEINVDTNNDSSKQKPIEVEQLDIVKQYIDENDKVKRVIFNGNNAVTGKVANINAANNVYMGGHRNNVGRTGNIYIPDIEVYLGNGEHYGTLEYDEEKGKYVVPVPTPPTKVSQLTNDSGFQTSIQVSESIESAFEAENPVKHITVNGTKYNVDSDSDGNLTLPNYPNVVNADVLKRANRNSEFESETILHLLFSVTYSDYNSLHVNFNYYGGYTTSGTCAAAVRFTPNDVDPSLSNIQLVNNTENDDIYAQIVGNTVEFYVKCYGTGLVGCDIVSVSSESNALNTLDGRHGWNFPIDDVDILDLKDLPTSDIAVYSYKGQIADKVDKETGKGLSTNDYTTSEKNKLSGIASGAEVNVQTDWNQSDNTADDYIKNKPTLGTAAAKDVGSANGVAELDSNGKVPSSQLPSYVDDVIEGYYDLSTDRFYEESAFTTVIPPEEGKSWVDVASNKSYRWTGSVYVRVDEGVQLGETASSAYRGDRGKTAYDHSQLTSGNPHNVTASDVGLGNVGNFKAVSTAADQELSDAEKINAVANIDALPKWCDYGKGYIAKCTGDGQYNYYKIGTLTIAGYWIDYPLVFAISGRGISYSVIEIMFQSTDSTDPGLLYFRTNSDNKFWIKKTDTSTWEIYGMYSEPWGGAFLHLVTGCLLNVTFDVSMTNISELPSGCIQVTYGGNVHYADTAAIATKANSTGLLVHGQDAPITSESVLNNEATYSNDGITYKIIGIADYYIIPNVFANGFILSIPWANGVGKYLRQFFIDDDANTPICVRTYTSNNGFSAWKSLAFSEEIPDTREAQTVSGNPITVADAEPMNAESVVVELEPKQDLHGYDGPWVGGAGKNLLENVGTTTTIEGVTFTVNDDGSVTLNRVSSSANNAVFVINTLNLKEGTRYRIVNSFANTKIYVEARYDNTSGTYVASTMADFTEDFVIPYGSDRDVCVSIVVKASESPSNVTVYPMLGYYDMLNYIFAPYSNICPITGYSEVNVERVGKNLCPIDSNSFIPIAGWTSLENENANTYTNGTRIHLCSGTYTFSLRNQTNINTVQIFKSNGDDLVNTSLGSASFTLNSDDDIYIRLKYEDSSTLSFKAQLELGNQATTYEPYQGNTYTIDLDGTKYGGILDVTEGEYSDEWGIFTEETVGVLSGSTSAGGLYLIDYSNIQLSLNENAISNMLPYYSNADDGWNSTTPCISHNGDGYARIYTDATSMVDFQTKYAGLQVVYPLATPSSVSTTPTDIPLLENTNNISTDGTNITLKYQPNNVIGECKAYTDEQIEKHNPLNYSTDEKAVGTWIDGKTIWQKTIEFDAPIEINNDYGTDITTYFTDIYDSIGTFVSAFSIGGNGNSCLSLYAQKFNNKVEIWRTINIAVTIENITIQYTKS